MSGRMTKTHAAAAAAQPSPRAHVSAVLPLGEMRGADFINLGDMAKLADVDPKTVRLWIDKGELPAPVGIGKSKGWTVEFLRDFLYNRLVNAQNPRDRKKIIELRQRRRQ